LYANYVESFGVNDGRIWLSDTQFKLAPTTSATQYEGGIKTEFFNGRLRANLAYFDLTKSNVATSDPAHPGFSLVTGAVQSRGYEFDVMGEILPGWNAIANYSYTDAIIAKSNEVDSSSSASAFGKQGSRYWGVPRNTARVWNTYEFQQGNLLGLKFGGGVTVRSGQVACCSDPAYTIPGYATVDLLAAYSRKVGKSKVTVQLNVDNLLDKHFYTGLNTAPFTNSAFLDFGASRTFMGSIGVQF
jgi:iron complex outermembrane receptor protein